MRTPITYWGGKQKLAPVILPLIPDHITYCEPFFGGGAIFFQKKPSEVEIINDLNKSVVNFYRQARDNFDALQAKIQGTLHSRACHDDALVMYQNPHLFSDLERAWSFWTLTNQGYSGKIGTWGYGTIGDANEKKLDNRRQEFTHDLQKRLTRVQIECDDALKIIRLRDRPTTFFYLDPPYFNSNMGHYGGYTEADFRALLETCSKIEGKFLMSSYPSPVLAEFVAAQGWHYREIEMAKPSGGAKARKVEALTANYPI
jgi:DNA adenine methylase